MKTNEPSPAKWSRSIHSRESGSSSVHLDSSRDLSEEPRVAGISVPSKAKAVFAEDSKPAAIPYAVHVTDSSAEGIPRSAVDASMLLYHTFNSLDVASTDLTEYVKANNGKLSFPEKVCLTCASSPHLLSSRNSP